MKRIKRNDLSEQQIAQANKRIRLNLCAAAFSKDTSTGRKVNGKSPWMPSVTATVRVTNPLPIPAHCPCCSSQAVECVHHDEVYGRAYSEWPWMLRCSGCDALVGLHPFTNIPLGTLASKAMRAARMRAKDAFNPLWQDGHMTRREAYQWLARQMGISNVEECHIGWFDEQQCKRVISCCQQRNMAASH